MRSVGAALVERAAQKNKTPALPLRKKAAAEPTTEETARRTTKRPGTAGRQKNFGISRRRLGATRAAFQSELRQKLSERRRAFSIRPCDTPWRFRFRG